MKNREMAGVIIGEGLVLAGMGYVFVFSIPWLMSGGWGKVIVYFLVSPWIIGMGMVLFKTLLSCWYIRNHWIKNSCIGLAVGWGIFAILQPWKFPGSYSLSMWVMGILISLNAAGIIGAVLYIFYREPC